MHHVNDLLHREFKSRLVSLSTGQSGLRTCLQVEAKALDDGTLLMVASDETLDRYDEIISAEAWQLDNYLRNPVIQNSHRYDDILHTLGKAVETAVQNGRLVQRWQFATEINPTAKIAHGLYAGGFLRASSVGFIPKSWENGSEQSNFYRRYTAVELIEVSAVGVPANPNALVMGLQAGAIEASDLRSMLDQLTQISEATKTGSGSHAGSETSADAAQLAEALRMCEEILRRC